jgi:(1->4)-alpha-D-glucan 1-alpha-D-glucosylmutase
MASGEQFNTGLTATYRFQFHKDFPFAEGAKLAGYLRELGISHVYASPIMQSKPGSLHGYDVTDFAVINPELGGEDGFRQLAAALREKGLGLIVDIVPNHMAVGGSDNPYWLDLLEKGPDSAYADFFDVDFRAPGLEGRILTPFLGVSYAEALKTGELVLKERPDKPDSFAVYYHDNCFPVRDVDRLTIRAKGLKEMNKPDALHALLERQHYRIAHWRTANDILNYRRFFEITTLAGVRIEQPEAFDKVHRVPLQLYAEGLIDGVRVDHIDGLTDPAGYCEALRLGLDARRGERPEGRRADAYIVVENILAMNERLPPWPIQGTTGYDFMNEVSAVQHRAAGAEPLQRYWVEISRRTHDFDLEETYARSELLERNFLGQLDAVVDLMHRCALSLSSDRDLTRGAMRRSVISLIRHLRVYRSYARGGDENPGPGPHLDAAFKAAFAEPSRDDQALALLQELLSSRFDSQTLQEAIRRFNQLTAPVAAKAVEDTAFYRYGVLLSRNDVGFDASRMAMPLDEFHRRMAHRASDWPHGMLTTATHDHKRGEDARARLAVLSEIPEIWIDEARAWSEANAELRGDVDPADEYMLFQTLVGAWPYGLKPDDAQGLAEFAERIAEWQQKALREGKLRSSWLTPNADYEEKAQAYAKALLDPKTGAPFLQRLASFVGKIARPGMANSLTQVALRCLAPGVPDLYRGGELWDLTLVDPDNRRPVDYALRARLLAEAAGEPKSGALKLTLIRRLLDLRRRAPDLFAAGDYEPIRIEARDGVEPLGFVRRHGDKAVVVLLALRAGAALFASERLSPEPQVWGEARLDFDLTGFRPIWGPEGGAGLRLAAAFADSPVAVWARI